MKRILVIGIIVVVLASLVIFAIPALAQDPAEEDSGTSAPGTREAMHEACEEGAWQAMTEAAEAVHGDLDDAPCYDRGYWDSEDEGPDGWGGMMGGHWGGWGGMMGW